jgi:hypothetical protein
MDSLIKLSYTDIQGDNINYNYMQDKLVELLPIEDLDEMSYEEFVNFKINILNDYISKNS